MLIYLVIALTGITGAVPGQAEFKTKEVAICVNLQANIYTYKVTNLSISAIKSFEVSQHVAYNFTAPNGWQIETSQGIFRAWTNDTKTAIATGKTAEFSLRVSSKGAVLGGKKAKVEFQSGKTITVPGVWSPVQEPKSYIFWLTGLILLLLLLHTAIVTGKDFRRKKLSISDA